MGSFILPSALGHLVHGSFWLAFWVSGVPVERAGEQPGPWEFPPFHSHPEGLQHPKSQKSTRECSFPSFASAWNCCGQVDFLQIKSQIKEIRGSGYLQS